MDGAPTLALRAIGAVKQLEVNILVVDKGDANTLLTTLTRNS